MVCKFFGFLAISLMLPGLIASVESPAQAQEPNQRTVSFSSLNYNNRYIRHRSFLGYIDPIVRNDMQARKDATFRIVPGLAGKCNSFESINYPGYFLRHQYFRIKLDKQTGDQLFKDDATFCISPGLANPKGISFASVNFPGYYIRHSNFELWLNQPDGSRLYNQDATFAIAPALTDNSPPVPIDSGANLVPAPGK